ncbi:hypothetical protein V5N11_006665 [Cardamine amara subsp. amara]|uniref:Uncharacterized protein n=1 Tax=Cardamine amara subsp. amara TaxID=228776 RepID=A0ABD1BFK6_CARAN
MGDDYLLLRVIGIIFAFSSLVSSDQLLVVGETGELLVTPSLQVKGSPRLNQDLERIHIRGFPRFQHIDKYSHSLKIIVNASSAENIHVCFHGNLSLAIGMCPQDQWEKISNGSWIKTMSLFDHRIIDIKIASASKITLQVSTVQEWFLYRIVFLVFGTVLLLWASTLSKSMAFYYITILIVGVVIFALLLLSQVEKHLQGGRSFWKLSLLALSYFILPYIPSDFQSMLKLMGCEPGFEEACLLTWLMFLHMLGVILGLYAINSRLLLTRDGSIDIRTSTFMSWSIWFFAAVLILQSSKDRLLAVGALCFLIITSPMLRRLTDLVFPLRVRQIIMNLLLLILEGVHYVVGPTVTGYARDFRQRFVSMFKELEPSYFISQNLQLNPDKTDLTSLLCNLEIDTSLSTLVRHIPTFSNKATNDILAMKQAQDVLIQAIKNQQQNQAQYLQTYYTSLEKKQARDLATFVNEFDSFSNNVTSKMLALRQAQNALLVANFIDPKTLLPMFPPA